MLKIDNISLSYGSKCIFSEFSFKSKNNGLVLIKGDSGKGKTTLLEAVFGLKKPNKGKILINNIDIYKLNYFKLNNLKKETIAYLSPEFYFINKLSLEDNLTLLDVSKPKFLEFAKYFNLDIPNLEEYVDNLSSGEKAKAVLIVSLLKKYKIYLFDEIYGSLDRSSKEKLKDILIKLKQESLILLATQDDYFQEISDEVIEL